MDNPKPWTIEPMDPAMVESLRSKSPGERLQIAWGMWRSAREMLLNLLRHEHPEWSDEQVRSEVARRLAHGSR